MVLSQIRHIDEIFLPYDIRGIYKKTLTDDLVSLIGKAVGSFLKKKIIVGRDVRWSSPRISENLISSITSTGCDVIDIGEVANPVLYFHCFKRKIPGVYITASHNPKKYNGMKFCRENGTSFLDELKLLKKSVKSGKFKRGRGKLKLEKNASGKYIGFLKSKVKIRKNMNFVADAYYGASSLVLRDVFNSFNFKAKLLRNDALPDFGGIKPEPKPGNMRKLAKLAKDRDFAVAFDGDGDRALFVDDEGEIHNGSEMFMFFSKFILKKGDSAVASFTCSKSVQRYVKNLDAKLHWSKTGHNYIENELVKRKAVFGGEQSSHFYFNKIYPFSDGILSTLMLCQALSSSKEKFSEIMKDIPKRSTVETTVQMRNHKQKRQVMRTAKKILKEVYKWTEVKDGVRFSRTDYVVLVRQSNTSPVIRVQVEAETKKIGAKLVKKFKGLVLKIKKDYR